MIYILILIGILLVFISLKLNTKPETEVKFDKLLQSSIDSKDIEEIVIALKDFASRIENLEATVVLLEDEIAFLKEHKNLSDREEYLTPVDEIYYEEKIITPDPIEVEKKDINDINNTIYRLYDEGTPVEDISSITKIGKGEILLRLGLRKDRK